MEMRHLEWGHGELTNQKIAQEIAWKMAQEMAREMAWGIALRIAQKIARGIAHEMVEGQNYLRKTVIGGNVAFRMG